MLQVKIKSPTKISLLNPAFEIFITLPWTILSETLIVKLLIGQLNLTLPPSNAIVKGISIVEIKS